MTGTCSSIIKPETFQIYVAAGADLGGGQGPPFQTLADNILAEKRNSVYLKLLYK